MYRFLLTVVGITVVLCRISNGFNIDLSQPIIHTGPVGSLFGYAGAMHREDGVNWLLVGAPRGQTDQPGVLRGGSVYLCPVSTDGGCQQIVFDSTGHQTNFAGYPIGSKSDQFFGATLRSAGPDGPVVACAPRRMWSVTNYTSEISERFVVGGCFLATDNFTKFEEFTPCEDYTASLDDLGLPFTSFCQAGFSAVISMDMRLVLGLPGSYYSQGEVLSADLNNLTNFHMSGERFSLYDNSYQGYTVAMGTFGSTGAYIVSEPRALNFLGQLTILDTNLVPVPNRVLVGEQMSAYFGHSMTVTDLNADGLDDLIVGAPMFLDRDNPISRWEVGRVYIYCQQAITGFLVKCEDLTGTHPGGQFGFAVQALGDIDRDGFNDIAVGAPFAGDDGAGLVYIYHGRKKGVKRTAVQVLRPADFGPNITSFGTSLSSGMDMDGNNYNDILIGAYMSSTSVLVRSRPIVKIQKSMTFQPPQINLDTKNYPLPTGEMVSSFNITTCFTSRGLDIPDMIGLTFSLQLDAVLAISSRAAFVMENNVGLSELTRTIQLIGNVEFCQNDRVYVKNLIVEKNQPIGVQLEYSLAPEEAVRTASPSLLSVAPILAESPLPVVIQSLPVVNTCKNYLCVPDLLLNARTKTERVAIGDNFFLTIEVSVTNYGEDAYESTFQADIPEGMKYARFERISMDISVVCSSDKESNTVTCAIGNPLPEEFTVNFGIILENDGLLGNKEEVAILMMVESLNREPMNFTDDNYANVTVGVHAVAELSFFGFSEPEQVLFNFLNESQLAALQVPETEQEAGATVIHQYMLSNLGPSDVGLTAVEIYWPQVDDEDNYIFYLISAELATGEECYVEGGVNPEDLEDESNNMTTSQLSDTVDVISRRRRQANESTEDSAVRTIECHEASERCVVIRCNVSTPSARLEDEGSGLIQIRSRLYEKTFIERQYGNMIVASTAKATVLSMPYMASILPETYPTATYTATTQVIGQSVRNPSVVLSTVVGIPLWVYILAVIGGALLLALIVAAMFKCGFFKRKKIGPDEMAKDASTQENWQNEVETEEKK